MVTGSHHSSLLQHIFSNGHMVTFPITSEYFQQWPQGNTPHCFGTFSAMTTWPHSPLFRYFSAMATRSHSPLFQYIFSSGHKVTFPIISAYFSAMATRSHSPLFQYIFSSGHKVTFPIISAYFQQWPQGHIPHYFSIFSAVATIPILSVYI